jgi:uncharacterized protein RhaS with RHS repeats
LHDTIEESGGLNLYRYVENDPIGLIDPSGENIYLIGIGIIAIIVAGVIVLGKGAKGLDALRERAVGQDPSNPETQRMTPEDLQQLTKEIDNLTQLCPSPGSIPGPSGLLGSITTVADAADPNWLDKVKGKVKGIGDTIRSKIEKPRQPSAIYQGPGGKIYIGNNPPPGYVKQK